MGNGGCKEVWFSLSQCLISSLDLTAIIVAFYECPVIPAVSSPLNLKPLHSISRLFPTHTYQCERGSTQLWPALIWHLKYDR